MTASIPDRTHPGALAPTRRPARVLLALLAGSVGLPGRGAVAVDAGGAGWDAPAREAAAMAEAIAARPGPRPAGSPAEDALDTWVHRELRASGWRPRRVAGQLVACRGDGARLFLAHIDSVPGSPGAIDNAAGVAALVVLAENTDAGDLCLAFPRGEEVGLVGSTALSAAWAEAGLSRAGMPGLVVALDLVGQGRLSVTGLGPRWGGAQLAWLAARADVAAPFAYRVVSRLLPGMERSDHRPFAERGVLALHLLGRGQGGVFARYHQPTDTEVDPAAMRDLLVALDGLATGPPPPADPPDAAVLILGHLLPAPAVWLFIGLGLLSGLLDLLLPCEGRPLVGAVRGLLRMAPRALVATSAAAITLWLCTTTGLWKTTAAEETAAAVMGTPPSGWWTGAPLGSLLGLLAFLSARRLLGGRGSAPLAAALWTSLALVLDPLLALPFAVAALLSRLHPLFALLPALYLLWPDKLRELAFHGLLAPRWWGLLWLLAWPAMGARGAPLHQRLRGRLRRPGQESP